MKRLSYALFALLVGCGVSEPAKKEPAPMIKHRERLLARIGNINDFSRPRPLVTLEEFFEGNNDPASIGYNLPDPPAPKDFYDLLLRLRNKPEVSNVLVEVKDLEDPNGWPSSDMIWIVTTASAKDVRSWFPERLAPDDVLEGFEASLTPVEKYEVPKGSRAIGVWYD